MAPTSGDTSKGRQTPPKSVDALAVDKEGHFGKECPQGGEDLLVETLLRAEMWKGLSLEGRYKSKLIKTASLYSDEGSTSAPTAIIQEGTSFLPDHIGDLTPGNPFHGWELALTPYKG